MIIAIIAKNACKHPHQMPPCPVLTTCAARAVVINATCSSGNAYTCAAGVTYSVFTFFFAAWKWSDRRDLGGDVDAPTFAFGPSPAQTLRQRVTTELAAGEWHYLGHVQHQGLNHTVHYYGHGDGFHQLRARCPISLSKLCSPLT